MHPYIAYALLAVIVLFLTVVLVRWRRSTSRSAKPRSFRYTFEDIKTRK